jgi:hypothetical protein
MTAMAALIWPTNLVRRFPLTIASKTLNLQQRFESDYLSREKKWLTNETRIAQQNLRLT